MTKLTNKLLNSEEHIETCRICLENHDTSNDELIQPCMCKTSYVHRNCLDTWMNSVSYSPFYGINDRDKKCEVCHAFYDFEVLDISPMEWTKTRLCIDVTYPLILFNLLGFLFGMLFTWNGKYVLTDKIDPYLYMFLFGSGLLHGIFGIFMMCRIYAKESNNSGRSSSDTGDCYCFPIFCTDGGGEGGEACFFIIVFLFILLAIFGIFILIVLVYEDAVKKSLERQKRRGTKRRVKDRRERGVVEI